MISLAYLAVPLSEKWSSDPSKSKDLTSVSHTRYRFRRFRRCTGKASVECKRILVGVVRSEKNEMAI